jgi:ribonuclease G
MSKNTLVISVDIRETRVALIEGGIIAELHIERRGGAHQHSGTVGDVVLGKVTRVLPGLQAAFVDIGQERAAFLHVEDLIRPDDFDAYLAGGRKAAREDTAAPVATGDEELDEEAEAIAIASPPDEAVVEGAAAENVDASLHSLPDVGEASDAPIADASGDLAVDAPEEADDAEDDADDSEDDLDSVPTQRRNPSGPAPIAASVALPLDGAESDRPTLEFVRPSETRIEGASISQSGEHPVADATAELDRPKSRAPRERHDAAAVQQSRPLPDLPEFPDMPGFTITNPGDPTPRAVPPPRAGGNDRGGRQSGGGGRGRSSRSRGRGRDGGGGGGRDGDRGRNRSNNDGIDRGPRRSGERSSVPNRISKSTPIRDVVREGQEIIVQVSKDPIGTKGARCTSHISLPGRYVVYLPTVDHIGISKRIGSEKERARLREAIEGMKPPSGGLIVRTVAEGLTKKQLKADVGYLVRLWGEIAKKREGAKAPNLLSSELDLVLKTARDLFTDEVHQVVIDDKHQYDRLCRFVEMFAPERVKDIIYYSDEEAIFDAYGIEDEIGRALSRKVPLPSGGHLVIDQAEALTAIDVNTGRFVGKGSKDMEETILKTNMEAVHEIAYQLRFRNIGGLIILDLIDMERHSNREKVRRALEDVLQKDKAKTTLNRISELGLIEMTRKRTRESLGRLLNEPCFYCDGTGQLQSKETVAYEILREIRRKRGDLPGYTVLVNAHPAVADILVGSEKAALADAENKYMRKITVIPRKEYHLEQFDIAGK